MEEKGVTAITLKKMNRSKVFQYIYREKLTSKLQIVQDLHMGLSTVSQNLNLLEQEGLIERSGNFESTGGRRAQAIRIVADVRISIGVGILKDMFHLAAIDLYGKVLAKATIPVSYQNTGAYYQQVTDEIKQFITQNHYPQDSILGVSIATQGILSPDGETVTYGVILQNAEMKRSDFSSRLPYSCHLEHDSKAAAFLEQWNHPDLDSAVVLLLNSNLGGAVITGHQVHQGMNMHSGVIEHLCLNPDGPLCYCGSRGCLETYCSASSLEKAAGMPIGQFFSELRTRPDVRLLSVWKDYLTHLAFAVRNLNIIIDSPVVISGYLAPFLTEDDLTFLLEQINSASPFSMSRAQLIVGTHGQYTPAVGAALFYTEQFLHSLSN